MPVSKPFAPGALAAALLFASTTAHAQTPPCDAVCAAHEAAVAGALPRHPDRAARHAALRALQAEPNRAGEWPDAQVRLNIEQLEIPMHMEPMVMLMVEQPLPNQRARSAGAAALAGVQKAEVARQQLAEAKTAQELRRQLAAWQQAAEREQVLAFHLQLLVQLGQLAALLPAGPGGPGRWLALQAEQAEVRVLASNAADEVARLAEQLAGQGVTLPPLPVRSDALAGLPPLPEALPLPDHASAAQTAWYEAERAAVAAKERSIVAEQAPVWSPGLGVMRMNGMPIGWMAMLGLRWPEAPWLAERNRQRIAHLAPQRARIDAERERLTAAQQRAVRDAARRWRTAGRQAEQVTGQLLPLAGQRVQALLPLVRTGQVTALELVSAVHAQLQYELQLVDARANWRLARADWLAAVDGVASAAPAPAASPSSASTPADNTMAGH